MSHCSAESRQRSNTWVCEHVVARGTPRWQAGIASGSTHEVIEDGLAGCMAESTLDVSVWGRRRILGGAPLNRPSAATDTPPWLGRGRHPVLTGVAAPATPPPAFRFHVT